MSETHQDVALTSLSEQPAYPQVSARAKTQRSSGHSKVRRSPDHDHTAGSSRISSSGTARRAQNQQPRSDTRPNSEVRSRARRNHRPQPHAQDSTPQVDTNPDAVSSAPNGSSPAIKNGEGSITARSHKHFGSRLTTPGPAVVSSRSSQKNTASVLLQLPDDIDLTSRLIHSFTHKEDGLDCPICFNSIHPAQPIWSCSTSEGVDVCCWKTFHLKCIRSWASKSTKETRDAYRARNDDHEGYWRCPACQTSREEVPTSYKCFCGRTEEPTKGSRLVTPHSCGERCIRPRTCTHPCSLPCHPGPCPPCLLSVERSCHCGQEILVNRCSRLQEAPNPALSCGRKCSKLLSCGKHVCQQPCHPGECSDCIEQEDVICYCGKDRRVVPCGDGESVSCIVIEQDVLRDWEGRFICESQCDQPYACGLHSCKDACHPPSRAPDTCPTDPSLVSTCPCGKRPIEALPSGIRTACSDPIPTCGSTCGKEHSSCNHACLAECHTGPCPPCRFSINVGCRCGQTMRYIACTIRLASLEAGTGDILCDLKCSGMRHCGRHACSRACCPLATRTQRKGGKGKKRAGTDVHFRVEDDIEGWHTCDLTCNKRLSCGNHTCIEPDHRGPCPSCLQSSFEELICNCGRTVIEPPVACGTSIDCPFPCTRPAPACGHPTSVHSCHEDGECPPCPHLTKKTCACSKSVISNVRCSQEKIYCGKACGKLMDCGYHRCDKFCHSGECGNCTQVCGKPRKSCFPLQHECISKCHAPSSCPEEEPCKAVVILRCECGRLQQPATCGASASAPTSRGHGVHHLKCNQECAVAKRNRNLAEALGIDGSKAKKFHAVWSDELTVAFRSNPAFGQLVEKTFNEFIVSDKKLQVLPHMPPQKRDYVRKVAEVYRIMARDIDEEPHRSVELSKRLDTRLPEPLLSKAALPATPIARRLTPVSIGGSQTSWGVTSTTSQISSRPLPGALPTSSASLSSNVTRYPNSALAIARQHAAATTVPLANPMPPAAVEDAPLNWEDEV